MIEAVFEDMAVKEKVFKTLDEVMKPGAILATNTSTLDVNKIAAFTKRPQDVIGTHFFSPANVMKLLEVVRGEKTAKDVLATVMALGKKIKKTCVVSGVLRRLHRQPHDRAVLAPGRLPARGGLHAGAGGQGDREVRLRDGPVPHGRPGRQRRRLVHPQAPLPREARTCATARRRPAVRDGPLRPEDRRRLVRLRAGQARRDPEHGRDRHDREAPRGRWASRRARSATTRSCTGCVYALVNEGAKILEEGIALRASDIDMVYLTGYGFPLHRGGPMCYADTVGLFNVVAGDEALRRGTRTTTRRSGSPRRCWRSWWPKARPSAELRSDPVAPRFQHQIRRPLQGRRFDQAPGPFA